VREGMNEDNEEAVNHFKKKKKEKIKSTRYPNGEGGRMLNIKKKQSQKPRGLGKKFAGFVKKLGKA